MSSSVVASPGSGNPAEPHLKSLTAARFVAALAVVLYHFQPTAIHHAPLLVRNLAGLGFAGIGFFFVLSGFVLSYIYVPREPTFKSRDFFLARFARIYPVYLFSFVLAVVPVVLDIRNGRTVQPDLEAKIPAYLFMVQSWLPWYSHEMNGAAWTLSVEAFFYVLFPLLLPWIARTNRRGAFVWMAVAAIAALIVPAVATGVGFTSRTAGFEGNLVRFFPPFHLPAFLFGAFLARVYEEDRSAGAYAKWPLPLGAAAILALIAFNHSAYYVFIHDGALIVPFGAIIYGLAAREGIAGRSHVPTALVLLGDASYGIYILQFPVWSWLNAGLTRLHVPLGFDSWPGWFAFACILSGFCVLVYRYLELPARRAIRAVSRSRWLSPSPQTEAS